MEVAEFSYDHYETEVTALANDLSDVLRTQSGAAIVRKSPCALDNQPLLHLASLIGIPQEKALAHCLENGVVSRVEPKCGGVVVNDSLVYSTTSREWIPHGRLVRDGAVSFGRSALRDTCCQRWLDDRGPNRRRYSR